MNELELARIIKNEFFFIPLQEILLRRLSPGFRSSLYIYHVFLFWFVFRSIKFSLCESMVAHIFSFPGFSVPVGLHQATYRSTAKLFNANIPNNFALIQYSLVCQISRAIDSRMAQFRGYFRSNKGFR